MLAIVNILTILLLCFVLFLFLFVVVVFFLSIKVLLNDLKVLCEAPYIHTYIHT